MDHTKLSIEVHKTTVQKGFWDEPKSDSHFLALVITEVAEAIEADRKNRRANRNEFLRIMTIAEIAFSRAFEIEMKDTLEDEFADIVIRLLDLAAGRDINLDEINIRVEEEKSTVRDLQKIMEILSFTECSMCLFGTLIGKHSESLEGKIKSAITFVQLWAERLDIDLEFHITQKMIYNSLRESMHNKKY